MRGNRVVMPEKLWSQTRHQGVVRTRSRVREKVWWPDMAKQVEKLIRSCYPRQLVGPRPTPEPIRSTPLPQGPWCEIAVDLLEIPRNGHLLVLVDYYSKWPEVAFLSKTNAESVIKCMEIAPCKGIQDSLGFWTPCCGLRIPGTGFRIRAHWIPDSKKGWIPFFYRF